MTTKKLSTSRRPKRCASVTTAPAVDVTPFTIVIDTREQTPWEFAAIPADASQSGDESTGCIEVGWKIATLKSGDYSIIGCEELIAVERKSIEDLFGTIGRHRDRFERELERLNAMAFAAVVVEAEWSQILTSPPSYTETKPKTITRSVLAWQQRFPRVHWIMCPGRRAAEVFAYRVLERFWKDREKAKNPTPEVSP